MYTINKQQGHTAQHREITPFFLITLNNADTHTDVLQLHKRFTELNTLNFAKYHNLLLKGQK